MSKTRKRNKNGLVDRLLSGGLVFGTLIMLFVAIITSVGVVAVAGADEGELLISIKAHVGPWGTTPVCLSPDWKKVAFTGSEDMNYSLCIVDSDGSNLKKLTEGAAMVVSWSPNGEKILYSDRAGLWIMNSDGSNKIRIDSSAIGLAVWSPDGKKIAYGYGQFYVINSDESDKKLVDKGMPLSWTPNGKEIIFSKESGIWKIDLDSAISKKLNNLTTTEIISDYEIKIAISPDGNKIAYEKQGIWVMDIDGSDLKQLTQSEYDMLPRCSPDSKRIAFISKEEGIRKGIWIMDADGSNQKKLTSTIPIYYGCLSNQPWSRDGSKIAYAYPRAVEGTETYATDIYTINVGKPSPIKPPTGGTPSEKQPGIPGFEAIFAIAGLLEVAYLLKRRE